MSEFEALVQALIPFIQFGFIAGLVIAVVIAAGKIGFKLAPYIIVGAALVYFFG
jgi:hypothetical protein